jgi:hypothetical protein
MVPRQKRTHRMARAASAFQTIEYISKPRWSNSDDCFSDEKTSTPALSLSHGLDRLQVVSEAEAARLLNLSVDTLRRRGSDGTGPIRINLSARRVGYRLGDLAAWLDQRASKPEPV